MSCRKRIPPLKLDAPGIYFPASFSFCPASFILLPVAVAASFVLSIAFLPSSLVVLAALSTPFANLSFASDMTALLKWTWTGNSIFVSTAHAGPKKTDVEQRKPQHWRDKPYRDNAAATIDSRASSSHQARRGFLRRINNRPN